MTVARKTLWISALAGLAAGCALAVTLAHLWRKQPASDARVAAPTPADLWKQAATKVEEDRGEPVGANADVDVPPELRHYGDRRRFLAVQVAESRKQHYQLPADYADLAALILRQQLVEVAPVGEDYVLFGAGESASDQPFTHLDRVTGESIPLFATEEEYSGQQALLADSIDNAQVAVTSLERDLRINAKRTRAQLRALKAQLAAARDGLADVKRERDLLEAFHTDPIRREIIRSEHRELAELAADFVGQVYDLTQPVDRRNLKVRLLSFIRPQAHAVLLEIAHGYREKFNRPLPVTSLVRTEQYQRELARTNRSAAHISAAPHTTGLAFDLYNRFMTAAEQNHLMTMIAQLKSAGRVEALKENRDHIHVFVFPDGRPPRGELIAQSLQLVGAKRRPDARPQVANTKRKRGCAR